MLKEDTTLEDNEIIHRILTGEKHLYENIVRKYNPVLYKVGRSYNFNHDDTQDLMQETYINAYKNLAKFQKKAALKTWLVRIMLNNCYHKTQKSSFKNETAVEEIYDSSHPMFVTPSNNPNKKLELKELDSILEHAVSQLSEEYRMVFSMREINGFNVRETANILKISESNVKVRLNRAKTMLKNILGKDNITPELFGYNLVYCNPFTANLMGKIHQLKMGL